MADSTPIIVAAITVLVTVTVALIANVDTVRNGLDGGAEASTPSTAGSRAAGDDTAPPAAGASRQGGRPGSMSVNGLWKDRDGYLFRFIQDGTTISYTATKNGQDQGGGNGTIVGDKLDYAFHAADNAGTCTATLSPDRMTISGTCTAGPASWPMTVTRTMLKPPTLHVARP